MSLLTGTLFIDLNGNSTIEAGETLLQGWTVFVDVNGNGVLESGERSATTNASGQYTIENILTGIPYEIRILDSSGNRITFNNVTGEPTGSNTYLFSAPSGLIYDTTVGDAYLSRAFSVGTTRTIDFENAETLLGTTNADNIALTEANQVWAPDGFKFWRDNNGDNIPDVQQPNLFPTDPNGGALLLEKTNRNGSTDSGFGFTNDLFTGVFETPNRNDRRIFDIEQPRENGNLGSYFLRGGGLFTSTTIPNRFLLEYTAPAASGSGTIWDIDTTWGEFTGNLMERWQVEYIDRRPDGTLSVLGSELSPFGEPVWVKAAEVDTFNTRLAALYGGTIPGERLALTKQVSQYGGADLPADSIWLFNPNSLDARSWRWGFDSQTLGGYVDFVRITFLGSKNFNSDVGLAFDNFEVARPQTQTADFGVYQPARIGDRVWSDSVIRNGILDPGESGVDGVTVRLLDGSGNAVLDSNGNPITTTTAGGGLYGFNVRPGTYRVEFDATGVSGFDGFVTANQGLDDALDSDATAGTNPLIATTGPYTVASGQTNLTIDAGLLPPEQQLLGSIGDFIWSDANSNGLQDADEPGIEGVTVTLFGPGGATTQQQTGANGEYLFDGLAAGDYRIEVTLPSSGYSGFTLQDQGGDDGDDSDVNASGSTGTINLSPGENDISVDAGLVPVPANPVKIGDFVWLDLDKDGTQDSNEPGLGGIGVQLLNPDGSIAQTTTTDNYGAYHFNVLPGANHQLQFVFSSNYGISPGNAAADNLDSDIDSLGRIGTFTVPSTDDLTLDAGLTVSNRFRGWTIGSYRNTPSRIPAPYSLATNYESIFGNILPTALETSNTVQRDSNPIVTVDEALRSSGNTLGQNLLRQSTAALFNSLQATRPYPLGSAQIIALTQDAFLSGDTTRINNLATLFDGFNNIG